MEYLRVCSMHMCNRWEYDHEYFQRMIDRTNRLRTSETVGAIIVNMDQLNYDSESEGESMPGLQERQPDDWSSCDDDSDDNSSYNEWMGYKQRSLKKIIGGSKDVSLEGGLPNLFFYALSGRAQINLIKDPDFYRATE